MAFYQHYQRKLDDFTIKISNKNRKNSLGFTIKKYIYSNKGLHS